jgi:alpha-tubulin suppressor-like RCC1 family protein
MSHTNTDNVFAEKGKTFSFGDNSEGQLGIRLDSKLEAGQTKFSSAIRVRIPTDSTPLHIACGDYHTALVTGTVNRCSEGWKTTLSAELVCLQIISLKSA